MEYSAPSDINEKLKVQILHDEQVLRHMMVRLDKYAVEYNAKKKVAYQRESKSSGGIVMAIATNNRTNSRSKAKGGKPGDIKYLTAIKTEKPKKKFCRFKKYRIRYIDYKDAEFLKKFLNEQGKLLPRRLSGNSLKYQRKVSEAIKRARQMAILPYVTDLLK
jgi:small subunit ribosomal protein S18